MKDSKIHINGKVLWFYGFSDERPPRSRGIPLRYSKRYGHSGERNQTVMGNLKSFKFPE